MPPFSPARITASRHLAPVCILIALALLYWGEVLFTSQVLLPGAMLRGFAPFGSDPQASWNLLQWDSLGQYYPWRSFAARELQSGLIPLWNPYQFSGAPFIANGQSAVFYPLNLPFWLSFGDFGVARAFGISAFLHTLLASLGTYALLQSWKLSRAASLLGAVAFGFCGYLASWVMLPTLANTASWLPLCVLLLERAAPTLPGSRFSWKGAALLALALSCALLAGHAQVFFYILVALLLRALFITNIRRSLGALITACVFCVLLSALQVLPTLELARNGHRAGSKPTMDGWNFLVPRALQISDFPSLFVPGWQQYSFSENFGYIGVGIFLLAIGAVVALFLKGSPFKTPNSKFAAILALFGILYATATPLAQAFYFFVPGLSQMGGVGRALILWSFGAALLAAIGLDALRRRWNTPIIPVIALFIVLAELFGNGFSTRPTAPRETIYPSTELTQFLLANTNAEARVLLLTPRNSWLPTEVLQQNGRNHPVGVLPPNGAMAYGIYDVAGYDSLASRAYREFLAQGEGAEISPALNGNMMLPENTQSSALDALGVRYVVSLQPLEAPGLTEVLRADNSIVYERALKNVARRDGKEFSPGWREGKYQPEAFRLGGFLSLFALGLVAAIFMASRFKVQPSS